MKWKTLVIGSLGALFVTLTGGLYWFSTLPGLSTADGGISVRNCSHPRNKNAKNVCSRLFCKKALLESGKTSLREEITVIGARRNTKEGTRVYVGEITSAGSSMEKRHFRCAMRGDEAERIEVLSELEYLGLVGDDKLWEL